ncbi:MAG: prepilin-type N-terminal cleavage/methylation domain-containing protein [Verrucomicrobiota bacterium]
MNQATRRAFTLVELLIGIAVVTILTAILIPTVGGAIKRSHQAKCLQNLRSIGTAIQLYTIDHKGFLPGPTYHGQKAGPDDSHFLSAYLRYYLGDERDKWTQPVQAFRCPSTAEDENAYVAAQSIRSDTANSLSPWGLVSGNGGRNKTPMRLNELDAHYKLSGQWAIRDYYGTPPKYRPWTNTMAGPPRHGTSNVLFFDGHVEAE